MDTIKTNEQGQIVKERVTETIINVDMIMFEIQEHKTAIENLENQLKEVHDALKDNELVAEGIKDVLRDVAKHVEERNAALPANLEAAEPADASIRE